MEFSKKKLPREAVENLRLCPIHTVQPYALMLAPAYVFMRLNEKFVSVKAPLDFFTPDELEKLKPFESIFFPIFIDSALPFRTSARTARALMAWEPSVKAAPEEKFPQVPLPPAPFELSDAILRAMGPLWSEGPMIEPFFVAIFANELCDLLPGELLTRAREASVDVYERAVFVSSLVVFIALHLGYCDLAHLNRLRKESFEDVVRGKYRRRGNEADGIVRIAIAWLESAGFRMLHTGFVDKRIDKVSQKLSSRLKRVKASFIVPETPVPSIYGEKGFVDA